MTPTLAARIAVSEHRPLNIKSPVRESNESDVFVRFSHIFATARDWPRFGLLLIGYGIVTTDDSEATRLLSREGRLARLLSQ